MKTYAKHRYDQLGKSMKTYAKHDAKDAQRDKKREEATESFAKNKLDAFFSPNKDGTAREGTGREGLGSREGSRRPGSRQSNTGSRRPASREAGGNLRPGSRDSGRGIKVPSGDETGNLEHDALGGSFTTLDGSLIEGSLVDNFPGPDGVEGTEGFGRDPLAVTNELDENADEQETENKVLSIFDRILKSETNSKKKAEAQEKLKRKKTLDAVNAARNQKVSNMEARRNGTYGMPNADATYSADGPNNNWNQNQDLNATAGTFSDPDGADGGAGTGPDYSLSPPGGQGGALQAKTGNIRVRESTGNQGNQYNPDGSLKKGLLRRNSSDGHLGGELDGSGLKLDHNGNIVHDPDSPSRAIRIGPSYLRRGQKKRKSRKSNLLSEADRAIIPMGLTQPTSPAGGRERKNRNLHNLIHGSGGIYGSGSRNLEGLRQGNDG